ncbi:MAG TPA: hypothetical protein GX008_06515 [Firmicutes bacterium]|jgi:hypothetical protein|nr:MAG: hypothetical protein AA931_04385 [Peptococcaceae bacterium 1109]HHT73347.1 hypothetical protein [Bacillota bacterium]
MLAAAAVVLLYVLVGVAEVMSWEERKTPVVLTYGAMMGVICILTALLALGIEPPKLILRNLALSLIRRLGIGG